MKGTNSEIGFLDFCKRFFPDVFGWEWSDCHIQFEETVGEVVLGKYKRILQLSPRNSGKTRLLSFAAPIWAIMECRHRDVLTVASSEHGSVEISDLMSRVANNDDLKKHYCPNGERFDVKKSSVSYTNSTGEASRVMITSPGRRVSGLRLDLIIVGDWWDDADPVIRATNRRWLNMAVLPALKHGGSILFNGTMEGHDNCETMGQWWSDEDGMFTQKRNL